MVTTEAGFICNHVKFYIKHPVEFSIWITIN